MVTTNNILDKTFIRRGCTCNSYKAAEGGAGKGAVTIFIPPYPTRTFTVPVQPSRASVNKNTRIVIFTVQLLSQLSNATSTATTTTALVDMRNKSNFQFLQPQVAGIKISGHNSLVVNATRCLSLFLSLALFRTGPLSGLRVLKTLKCSKKHEFFMYF